MAQLARPNDGLGRAPRDLPHGAWLPPGQAMKTSIPISTTAVATMDQVMKREKFSQPRSRSSRMSFASTAEYS